MDNIFGGLFDTATTSVISVGNFLLCIGVALVLGLIMALCFRYKNNYSKSFTITLALLPAIVCVVIMMVNGNIGAGVAIAGAFGLVRFRSMPGDARQIALVFLAMGAGLITGMGYLAYAALFTVIMCVISIIYNTVHTNSGRKASLDKTMKITIPEDLDYTGVFDEVLENYTSTYELIKVATSNMGSLYKLTYDLKLKDAAKEKEMIDELRCRNGNLEIIVSRKDTAVAEL